MSHFEGKVAIVTGGGSGIGREVALNLARHGANVVISDIDESAGQETKTLAEQEGPKAGFVKADSSKPADNENLVKQTVELFSKLDIAINNAGIGGAIANVADYELNEWEKVISINLSGVFYGMKYQIPAMLNSGGGSIVNISSILGQVGFLGSGAYVAAKHGVVGLTKAAALEYSSKDIRVNSVGPGFINTPLVEESMSPEERKQLVDLHPIGRLGEAEEVAEVIAWLASDKASFVSGAYFPVDGGYLAR